MTAKRKAPAMKLPSLEDLPWAGSERAETRPNAKREARKPAIPLWLTELSGAHPRAPNETRDEIELYLRDAFAAGCQAAQERSLFVAMEYAKREAPKLRALLKQPAIPPTLARLGRAACDYEQARNSSAAKDALMRDAIAHAAWKAKQRRARK